MYPYIHIGAMEVPTYILIFGVGYVLMTLYACKVGTEYGYDRKDMIGVSIYALVGLILGAKLLYFVTVLPAAMDNSSELSAMWSYAPLEVIDYLLGGMVYYGGLAGAIVGAYVYSRKHFLPYTSFMDIYAPLIPFVHACGRVGCFMGGCCYGIEYDGFGCVRFPEDTVCRVPVQLIEAVLNIVVAIVLEILRRRRCKQWKDNHSRLLGIYLTYYAIVRFLLEFLRGDAARGGMGVLSTSQIISLIVLPIGVMLLIGKKTDKRMAINDGSDTGEED